MRLQPLDAQRLIVIRGTEQFGRQAKGSNEPGLLLGIAQHMSAHPEWFISAHVKEQSGMTVLSKDPADRPASPIHLWPPGRGPGTEFKKITTDLGIQMPPRCDCNRLAADMDMMGPGQCKLKKDELVKRIKENQDKWSWREKISNFAAAAANSLVTGLAFKVDPLDPIPGLIDEAIRRAEQNA